MQSDLAGTPTRWLSSFIEWTTRLRDHVERRHVVLICLIFTLAVVFRVRNLGAAPLWIDEAHTSWAARNYLSGDGFSDPVGSSSPYRRAWLTASLPVAASFALLGTTEFAARFPMVLYGCLTVGVAYLVGAQFHRLAGYMLASFVAVEPFVVVWTRTARMYAPLIFLYLASLYVMARWYTDRDLELISPYPLVLAVLAPLGIQTHRAYLAFGAVVGAFLGVTLLTRLWQVNDWATDSIDPKTRRVGILFVGSVAVAVAFVAVRGFPTVLTAEPPAAWPERGTWYYWSYLVDTYIFLPYLGAIGAIYLWMRDERARLFVLGFVLPLLVASVTPRKAPRFIVHLLPVLGVLVFVPLADGLRFIWERITAEADVVGTPTLVMAATGPILLLVLLALPLAGFTVADDPYNPPHQPERSDWGAASSYVSSEAADDAIIVSTRPELSMWYYGETDYFFRQHSVQPAVADGAEYVHPRTGAVYLNETTDVQRLLDGDREIWLFAGKKFHESFTAPEARQLVEAEFEKMGEWTNIELYYYPGNE